MRRRPLTTRISLVADFSNGYQAQKRLHEFHKGIRVQPAPGWLDFGLLRYLQRVIYLDPEVSNGAFELAMTKQELNGP